MEDQAGTMRHAAEVQEAKLTEMGRERDVLMKLRHKAEGSAGAQVGLFCHSSFSCQALAWLCSRHRLGSACFIPCMSPTTTNPRLSKLGASAA